MKKLASPCLFLTVCTLALLCVTALLHAEDKKPPVKLRTFESPYYIIQTDLEDEQAREAYVRMTRMYEEYKRRTAGFSGDIKGKFPFFLFKNGSDYTAAGGPAGSAGVFMRGMGGSKLMAIAGEKTDSGTWHVVQHEGFHQFAAGVIRGDLPVWLNEGLAEYFGESIFTGDSFVSGVISPGRLTRIKSQILEKKFKPFADMMVFSNKEWNANMSMANYDQAWAMVHFLAQGEDGKYQKAFVKFMSLIGQGRGYMDAWADVFGRDHAAFQKKFEQWWTELPEEPTRPLFERAALLTITSFYARAQAQGQIFESAEAFLAAAGEDKVKITFDDYLPISVLKSALRPAKKLEDLTLKPAEKTKPAQVSCKLSDGSILTATYVFTGKKVKAVEWQIMPAETPTKPADGKH